VWRTCEELRGSHEKAFGRGEKEQKVKKRGEKIENIGDGDTQINLISQIL
jgi:hypothetical protein